MNLYDAIHQRRTVHNYEPVPVDGAVMDRILAAAHMAPNHKLTWPWCFTVVGPETRQALLPVAYELKNAVELEMQRKIHAKLTNPGALVVVTQHLCDDEFRRREDYAATCCAIQNIQLAARAEGLGSKWSTGALTQHPRVCEILGISVEQECVVGFIWLGTPAVVPSIERPPTKNHIRHLP